MIRRKGNGAPEERLTQIYERYAAEVAAYAFRRASSNDAADAVAETFLVAWRRLDEVPPEPETLPWLYGVVRRVMSNQRRGDRRRSMLGDRLASRMGKLVVAPPSLDEKESMEIVLRALRQLPPDDAEMLKLVAWESLTPTEIANVLGISPGAARKRLHRARRRLRSQLAADRPSSRVQRRDRGPGPQERARSVGLKQRPSGYVAPGPRTARQ